MPKVSEKRPKLDIHRHTIYRLYITENKSLKQVMEIMTREHGLPVNDKQYKRCFQKWGGFEKNYKTDDMKAMLKIQKKRLDKGKETVFFNDNGEEILRTKFTRFKHRHKLTEFTDEELQEVETPRGINYRTPEPEDTKARQRNRPSTDEASEKPQPRAEEHHVPVQLSQPNNTDNVQPGHYQLPSWPNLSSTIWSQRHDGNFARTAASPAPSVNSMNTTICAPLPTMPAYASKQDNLFENNFSPQSTAFSDPGEYQLSARVRQGSISSVPPLELNHSRVGLLTNAGPSPALSATTLNTTIGCCTHSMEAYAPSEHRSAYATNSFQAFAGTHNSVAMANSVTASGQIDGRLVAYDAPQQSLPMPPTRLNWEETHNGHSSQITNYLGRPALSSNINSGLGILTYPSNNANAAGMPLSSPWSGDGQSAANASTMPALQFTGPEPCQPHDQGQALLVSSEHYTYAGDGSAYDGLPSHNAYAPAVQSYSGGTYPSYNSNNSYTAGYQGGNDARRPFAGGTFQRAVGHNELYGIESLF
ncbi:hypothetical protein B0T20DRAFT_451550 [Sordaria brevicollis]|uniref:Clr5 domain-containing protein n=1 Tax=Sordaria brevicollis TaxID=83679 RepID=A0AAE0UE73_SORBR|nr:hypothetical protein B0T20DRAFT_451550 [Sordaria brevicollis]